MLFITAQLERLLTLSSKQLFIAYVVLDMVCIGIGMGVPIFSIALGFPIGWWIVTKHFYANDIRDVIKNLLKMSLCMAAITCVGMILIWGWSVLLLQGTDKEISRFGLPSILFTPRASLIGWLILMIIVSPILQMLLTIFAGNLTLIYQNLRK